MTALTVGSLGFACLFLYDINSVRWKNKMLHRGFGTGMFFIALSTALALGGNLSALPPFTAARLAGIALAMVFLAALIYTLFFALPFQSTYSYDDKLKSICDRGVYATCRHPGFWCFAGFYASLYLFLPGGEIAALALSLIGFNFLYILLQDIWTFPNTFRAYDAYRRSTPFLIPTCNSIKKGLRTLNAPQGECHESEK